LSSPRWTQAELVAFLAEKVSLVKTITTEQLDFVAQLLGGVGSFLYVIIRFCDWRILLAWIGFIGIMMLVMPLQMVRLSVRPLCISMRLARPLLRA
jgi:uncharacterized membrane protein